VRDAAESYTAEARAAQNRALLDTRSS